MFRKKINFKETVKSKINKQRRLQNRRSLIAAVFVFVFIGFTVSIFNEGYSLSYAKEEGVGNEEISRQSLYRKFCWISYLDFQTYLTDKDETEFEAAVRDMYDKLCDYGIDTVIVQVRPMGDAIYPSEYFTVSEYISSNRILPDYDPLEIMIEFAHEKGLSFEAWINPYRLSRNEETTKKYKTLSEYEENSEFIYSYLNPSGEECLSLEPSDQRSIDLIIAGVREIINNYEVDGIHFDDYFYVDGMHDGTGDISEESSDVLTTEEKMKYVDSMISQVYEAVKESDPLCTFGVSPAGNLDVAKKQGADIDKWLSTPGYVDYIMPQIYWTDYYETAEGTVEMFTDTARKWQAENVLDLPIYVGLALYRAGEESETDKGWSLSSDNLAVDWQAAEKLGYDGYALFRYEWFDKDIASAELENLKAVSVVSKTEIVRSVIDEITTVAKKYLQ